MSRDTPTDAQRLLVHALKDERARTDARTALDAVTERLRPGFARWIGADGWEALVIRGRDDAGRAPGDDEDAQTLSNIADILTRLVGPALALQIIQQACVTQEPSARTGGRSRS